MNRKLYPDDLAEKMKGEKHYRPSNGTEGMMFMERWCEQCKRWAEDPDSLDQCQIAALTYWLDEDDTDYPPGWTYDASGQPCCTAFEEEK